MRARALAAGLLVALALAGCGDDGPSDLERSTDNLELANVEVRIASEVLNGGADGISDLPLVTDRYVSLLQRMREAGTISVDDARDRLAERASDVQEYCASCAARMDRAREELD